MAKKQNTELFEDQFFTNALSMGISYTNVKELWNKICSNSKYCFMKSHAISAVLLSYYDAYIKVRKDEKE